MPFVDTSWTSPETALDAEKYCAVCLIDENAAGAPKVKTLCSLPIRFVPNGPINRTAMHAAAAALAGARGGVQAKPESKRAAAKKLLQLYSADKQSAPASLQRVAG